MACEVDDYLIVAAIDFGTTFSGFAYSTRDDFVRDPTKVTTKTWIDPTGNLTSEKTTTSILFKPDKTFDSFGFDAEAKYMDLADKQEHEPWYFFSRFKMTLYEQLKIDKDVQIEDDTGKKMSAMVVFSESIKFLKNVLLEMCQKQIMGFRASDIKWVLTVPAIWTDAAKRFMRNAAESAGIPEEKLVICLEPEAAAMCVRYTPLDRKLDGELGDSFQMIKPGSKYIVFDAGGGTIDITTHAINDDGFIREIHRANGGDWGGTNVDKALRFVLDKIFGTNVMSLFSKRNKYDMLDMMRNFEVKKRLINPSQESSVNIRVPASLKETFEELNKGEIFKSILKPPEQMATPFHELSLHGKREVKLKYALKHKEQYAALRRDRLELKQNLAPLLFEESTTAIRNHLLQLSKTKRKALKDINVVLMVGGYSESQMLQHCIRTTFPNKRLIIPKEASLSVLKGAVIYGHNPDLIKERICKYTYGVACARPFQDGVHREDYKFEDKKGKSRCNKLFKIFARKNESVVVGQVNSRDLGFDSHSQHYTYNVYVSTESDPMYTTDDSCTKIGSLTHRQIPKEKLDIYKDTVQVKFTFSSTELEVEVVFEKTGDKVKSYFTFES